MKKNLLFIVGFFYSCVLPAQNLVVNSYAEDLPRGTGWTIISQGASTCLLTPTSNFLNWTMIPDGSANYPFDHTTGVAGGTVFYSGCSPFLQGPFELRQDIDVSADALVIDAGAMPYIFTGYMQTPVSNQTDQGRFIVDYLDASGSTLGPSYTTSWQSYFGGSGNAWHLYTDTRIAPAGTRTVRIRLQTQILFNPPAINVYFDDITLVRPGALPVKLISFTGHEDNGIIYLQWQQGEPLDETYTIEQSSNGTDFAEIAKMSGNKTFYQYHFNSYPQVAGTLYYRLKMTDVGGNFTYSPVVVIALKETLLQIQPNPAKNYFILSNTTQNGIVNIISATGQDILTVKTTAGLCRINVDGLVAGVYFVRFSDGKNNVVQKLVIRH